MALELKSGLILKTPFKDLK